ncbi:MAG: thiolase family protein [Gammaproteobacteria bacterium]|nr:thiolase family protein [Gammaproteobacteria bacterium]
MNQVVITAAKRSAIGAYQGQYANLSAVQLASPLMRAIVDLHPDIQQQIDECLMGCVLSAGVGQAPARQALLAAGLPDSIPCTTINKVCGSSMKTVSMAFDALRSGSAELILAGGMESMSNAPYLLRGRGKECTKGHGKGLAIGHQQLLDHMFYDGLENPADRKLMGWFADQCATEQQISRQQQDAFAAESVQRARHASEANYFHDEIVAIENIRRDEQVFKSDIKKISQLKPVFSEGGSVTAANASSLSDGAALLLLATEGKAQQLGLKPLARVAGYASFAQAAEQFTMTIHVAIEKLLQQLHWSINDVDLFEINEAFAVVVLAAMRKLQLPHSKVNIHGGACAMGHPIGASGSRILVTLLHAMLRQQAKRGIACICIGGGEAMAVALEV